MVSYVPNYSFLNIEDVNNIIINEGVLFEDFYDLDTNKLESNQSTQYNNYRYDFILCSKKIIGSVYEYTLEIRNSLWDGTYSFIKLPNGVNKPNVQQIDNSPNVLRITGVGLSFFTIRLHLTNMSDSRIIASNNLKIKGLKDIEAPFYEENELKIQVTDIYDVPISSANVKMTSNGINEFNGVTTADGYVIIKFSKSNPGKYTCLIEAKKDGVGKSRGTIQLTKTKAEPDFNIVNGRFIHYKGAINEEFIEFPITTYNNQDMIGNSIKITYNGITQYTSVMNNNKAPFHLNLRGYYKDTVDLTVVMQESDITKEITKKITLNCEYYYAGNYLALESECENPNGSDLIRLKNEDNYDYTSDGVNMIQINRKITIEGEKTNNGWTTINGNGNGYFEVNDSLNLKGIKIINANPAIYQNKNSQVYVDGCLFTECENEKHGYMGTCIYTNVTKDSKTNKKLFTTTVRNTYFYNNHGSNISHGGQLDIDKSYFKKDNLKYFHQPEPAFISQLYGDCAIRNSLLDIDTGNNISTTNLSYSKLVAFVGKTAALNGKTGNQMNKDNSLNLFGVGYSNQAHVFVKYKYPYISGNPTLVASPENNKENTSCGHAVEGTNNAYKDGIKLTRDSWNNANTNRKIIINIPINGGSYVL